MAADQQPSDKVGSARTDRQSAGVSLGVWPQALDQTHQGLRGHAWAHLHANGVPHPTEVLHVGTIQGPGTFPWRRSDAENTRVTQCRVTCRMVGTVP